MGSWANTTCYRPYRKRQLNQSSLNDFIYAVSTYVVLAYGFVD